MYNENEIPGRSRLACVEPRSDATVNYCWVCPAISSAALQSSLLQPPDLPIMTTVDSILAAKYPAKAHARRVAEALKTHGDAGAIYLEAQKTRLIEDNDEAMPFRYVRSPIEPRMLIGGVDSVALSSTSPDVFCPTRRWSTISKRTN